MAIHSRTIAWKIPWTEEPGRLQSMGLQRVRHNWATSLSRQESWAFMLLAGHWMGNPTGRQLPDSSGYLHIWGYWYFSRQSWFQLVLHPAWHFSWCTLHVKVKLLLCLTLCHPRDCSLPDSVHRIFQASILEQGAISFSRGSSRPRDRTHISCIGRQVLHH